MNTFGLRNPFAFAPGAVVVLLAALGSLSASCRSEPYCLNCVDGGSPVGDGNGGRDVQAVEIAVPDVADVQVIDDTPTDAIVVDAPCNPATTQTDPANCGMCGNVCNRPHARPGCAAGMCIIPPGGCDIGFFDIDNNPDNGCEYSCVPVPGATDDRTCNNRDDNCNGRIDEDIDLCTSPLYCGSCSRACALPHAVVTCARNAGTTGTCTEANTHCEIGSCATNYFDINGMQADGCEYFCMPTGAEVCDGIDNDCDGMIDEGDPGGGAACGSTVGACRQGVNHCIMGSIQCMGGQAAVPETCNNVDDDCNGMVDDGTLATDTRIGSACGSGIGDCRQGTNRCMAGAVVCTGATGPVAEVCDGRDNNCDGMIDNGVPPGAACGGSIGACRPGTLQCVGGSMRCMGGVQPTNETCDTMDNDCDGTVDNGFNLTNDVRNCGRCGNACSASLPNAYSGCVAGACSLIACMPGFVDLDRNASNGCEYSCTFTSMTELCDGLDNNCNGTVDEGVTAPAGFCRSGGACGATAPAATCMGRMGFRCAYPAGVQTDPMTGQPVVTETLCDGIDNNCNGAIDESFTTLMTTCRVGPANTACENVGMRICSTDHTTTVCSVTAALPAGTETCNGIDDDCDGAVDETATTPGSAPSFVATAWSRVQPSNTCGLIPGSTTQALCTGNANCNAGTPTQCNAGFWCDATVASRPGATTTVRATCNPYFFMTQYEVSAPGATATARGTVLSSSTPRTVSRACSVQGVVPWTSVTVTDATAACTAIGATLCTEGQWQAACELRAATSTATTNCAYGYQTACGTYSGGTCNGLDFDFDTTMSGDQDGLLVTGSPRIASCDANWTGYTGAAQIHDISGNAAELTAQRAGSTGVYPVRGGSYTSPGAALSCSDNWSVVDNQFFFPNTGFRCCFAGATAP